MTDLAAELLASEEGRAKCYRLLDIAERTYADGTEKDAQGFPQWEILVEMPLRLDDAGRQTRINQLRVLGKISRSRPTSSQIGSGAQAKVIVELAFRGTVGQENWITNLKAKLVPISVGGSSTGHVHEGFQESYQALRPFLLQKLDNFFENQPADIPPNEILIRATGHSLGGALATLACYDLALSRKYRLECATWGSPRVGNAVFAEAYRREVPHTARFIIRFDAVPKLPAGDDEDSSPVHHVLNSLLRTPQAAVGVAGYVHVCPSIELDSGAEGAAAYFGSAASAGIGALSFLKRKRGAEDGYNGAPIPAGQNVIMSALGNAVDGILPHGLPQYRKFLKIRIPHD
eukprot:TRINITY_DN71422_c0_g1_i1.p1 TRINITY_DN71422_c0_g1~~TRINITY_DN71422_c0_g1_i1.p1  ORF type:complete len:346 (-),score=50.16 TRINITY_DN71422_c0_g1_i1:106-1143(-)